MEEIRIYRKVGDEYGLALLKDLHGGNLWTVKPYHIDKFLWL
jgi:hypothetical protein